MISQKNLSALTGRKTPFFFYDLELLDETLKNLTKEASKYNFHVHYALKANTNERIIKKIIDYKLGADCVSGNEVLFALKAGFSPKVIAFAGVGKTDEEINVGLENDIFCFNCESVEEINVINEIANSTSKKARIALRINPNVNAQTHHYITTGLEENKFGINTWELSSVLEHIKTLNRIELTGLHFHIGSQIRDLEVFKSLCLRVNEIVNTVSSKGVKLDHINVGGGLGVNYTDPSQEPVPDFESYFSIFNKLLQLPAHLQIHFELGRSLVAQCGSLISKVLYVKKGIKTNFLILDAGMTELIRPALYQAFHKVVNLSSTEKKIEKYDVVGPVCESSDCFGKAIMLPTSNRGDLIEIQTAGAYGEVMSSQYNLRTKALAVYSDEI
jgi:diaminopimelate decarboxylase